MERAPLSNRAEMVESLFGEAVELDSKSRRAFLTERCRDDAELRRELESLLKAFETHSVTVRNLFDELPLAVPPSDAIRSPETDQTLQ